MSKFQNIYKKISDKNSNVSMLIIKGKIKEIKAIVILTSKTT
ncbi:MAG TPA: hypothetical protein PKH50_01105 [bacterium]|nr:hypothetical protein [bacterium]